MNQGRRAGTPAPISVDARLDALVAHVLDLETRLQQVERRSGISAREAAELRASLGRSEGNLTGRLDIQSGALQSHDDDITRHTADILALTGGLDTTSRVAREAETGLIALKKKVEDLQSQFDESQKDALYLANLAYAYALMSQHWIIARDRVRSVIGEPTTGQTLLRVSTTLLAGGFQLALSAATGGVATGLFHAFGGPVVKLFGGLATTIAASSRTSGADTDGIRTDLAKDSASPVLGAFMAAFADGLTPKPWEAGDVGGTMTDPFQLFIDLEKELRNTAMVMANQRGTQFRGGDFTAAYRASVKSGFDAAKADAKLDALAGHDFWKFLFEPMVGARAEASWGTVSKLIAVRMRRLAWRMYCRAQWSNSLWSNTVSVDSSFKDPTDPPPNPAWTQDDAADWPRKVWTSQGGGWPAHWEVICSDFRGPEHIADHPANAGDVAEIAKARTREKRLAWISMAVVQCCQVKRDFGMTSKAFRVDLERNIHIAGADASDEAGAELGPVNGRTVDIYKALFEPEATARPLCEAIMTRGGILVRITEIRFGSAGNRFSKATGKKGRLVAPNSFGDVEMWNVAAGSRITVCVSSTEKTTRDAKIYMVKADAAIARNAAGEPTIPAAQTATKNFATSTVQWTNLTAPSASGLYCVTLSSRTDLRKEGTARSRQMHVPSEWWFRVP